MSAQRTHQLDEDRLSRLQELDRNYAALALASVNAAGAPHVAHTFFAWEFTSGAPSLIVSVLAHSAKMENIRRDARVGFTIGGNLPELWLNGHGHGTELSGDAAEAAHNLLVAKSEAVRAFTSRLPTAFVRIIVTDYRLTDVRRPGEPPLVVTYPS